MSSAMVRPLSLGPSSQRLAIHSRKYAPLVSGARSLTGILAARASPFASSIKCNGGCGVRESPMKKSTRESLIAFGPLAVLSFTAAVMMLVVGH